MTFAVITPALITGAIADRMRFGAWVGFIAIWSVARVPARSRTGCSPAAGSPSAARSTSPAAPSCTSTREPARSRSCSCSARGADGRGTPMPPHSLPFTLLGTGILWFGWFGFNAGSALAANGVAAQAFVNTFVAAAARCSAGSSSNGFEGRARDDARRRVGRGRRPGRDHAVRRVRRRHRADRHRADRRRRLLPRDQLEVPVRLRRLARRDRRAPRRRHHRLGPARPVRRRVA